MTREHLPRLLVLCLAIWLHAANTMLAATTLPNAIDEIGGLSLISWAFALYLMGSIVAATAVGTYVGDAGLRRTMMTSTLLYTIGCAVCATAPTMPILLVGRTVQGLGGGALVALVYIAQDRFFPNRLAPRIIACLSVIWMASALCGPLIGGAFSTAGVWRYAFWSFALQGLALVIALHPLLRHETSTSYFPARRIPVKRLLLVAGSILAVSLAGVIESLAGSMMLLLVGCLSLWRFFAEDYATSSPHRLLPGHAVDLQHPVGCGIVMTFILSLGMMSFVTYGPILLILLYDLTPLEAGFVVVTEALGWTAGALLLSGFPPARQGQLIRIGSVMLLAGILTQAWFLPFGPLWLVVVSAFLGNAGFGMIWGHIIKIVVENAKPADRDRAAAFLPSTQQTAYAFGAALSGMIANGLGFDQMMKAEEFRIVAFWVFAGFVPLALLGNLVAWHFSRLITSSKVFFREG